MLMAYNLTIILGTCTEVDTYEENNKSGYRVKYCP